MEAAKGDYRIRPAEEKDARLLADWFKQGRIMQTAGYPRKEGTPEEVALYAIRSNKTGEQVVMVAEFKGVPIGEMYYEIMGDTAVVDIKICVDDQRNDSHGASFLRLLSERLFTHPLLGEHRIESILINCLLDNRMIRDVSEKSGFLIQDVQYSSWLDEKKNWRDAMTYELTRTRYEMLKNMGAFKIETGE